MNGQEALKVLADAATADLFSRNVADMRTDLPDTDKIAILVQLGAIRGARKALGIKPKAHD